MEALYDKFQTHLTLTEIAARLGIAILFGGLVGLNREWLHKPAGLRTHILVALASATFAVLARELFLDAVDEGGRPDPVRVVEAVVTGVAFLGAGTIIQQSGSVEGMTTGASIWLAGAIGAASGSGHYVVAAMCTIMGLVVLILVNELEHRVIRPLSKRTPGGRHALERKRRREEAHGTDSAKSNFPLKPKK
ncbi:MgtC/SapB family protein [Caenispirillum salinarum]|uniref:MgtC/SapB family protein n=1 Tax=Caenispirillum salinarum TaxID=859058 RepID=UPI003850BF8F